MGRGGAGESALREHLCAAPPARPLRAPRRAPHVRRHLSGGGRSRVGAVLRELRARGDCEIGAHHHAWETPRATPTTCAGTTTRPTSRRIRFERQVAALTDAIAAAVGDRPVSYRSGRFGFAAPHTAALERLGYLVESSIAPLFYEAHKRGPDFVGAPLTPYFLAYDNAMVRARAALLEVPVSAALNRLPRALQHLYARAPRPYTTKRVLRKLGIARLRWLRPSYSSLDDMIGLARDLARAREPVLNLLFHSSEAIVGAARTTAPTRSSGRSATGSSASSTPPAGTCARARPRSPSSAAHTSRQLSERSSTSHRTCRRTRPRTRCSRRGWATGRSRGAIRCTMSRTRRAPAGPSLAGPVTWIPRRPDGGIGQRLARTGSIAAAWRIWRAAAPIVRDADIVHIHSNGLLAELSALLAARFRRPYVLTFTGPRSGTTVEARDRLVHPRLPARGP